MSEQQNNIEEHFMLPVGTLLQGGKYRIERYLSSGGFGNTYVATNTEFDEQVAIKEFFMRGISQRDGDSVSVSVSNQTNLNQFVSQMEKFRKEARRLRKLHNSHIVSVHDLFEENGTAYYEMDLIKGESLSERLKCTGTPLSEAETLTVLDQVLDALAVVHAQGLYHLDLKPANIMMDQTGRVLLIDFGASKQMSVGAGESVSTSSALAFTPGYAPLEQTEQNMKSFGPWTDLYALGATLYKLLTNLTPPSASEILMMTTPLLFTTPVSAKTQQLIAWMMRPRLDMRPQSVDDVRRFLEGKQVDEETVVMDKPEQESKPKPQPKSVSSQWPTANTQPPTRQGQSSGISKLLWWSIGAGVVAAVVTAIVVGVILFRPPSVNPVNEDYLEADTGTTESMSDYYIRPLAKNLDEKNSVAFNENLRIINQAIEESLQGNNPREAVELAGAVRFFINTRYEDIKSYLGFSSETMQETEKLTKGTIQDFIQGKAKMLGVKLPADVFEDKESKSVIKESKSEMRIW